MNITNNEIHVLLHDKRETLAHLIEPFWYRHKRYKLPFCLFIIYAKNIDDDYFLNHIRKTDQFIRLDSRLCAIGLEAIDLSQAITIVEKLLYKTEDALGTIDAKYFSSIVCESAGDEMEELINHSFMILEYAIEYSLANEVLNLAALPTR
ncbi:hypothetical protein KKA17_08860 [bacterium]|nr:hypothetical protein [bacterium]MBU1883045.1 hypothetical protein [bacterium]